MKAAVLVKLGTPLEIMDLPVPSLTTGQVLVKIEYTGICGSQLSEINGWKGNEKFLPHMMGHEGSGTVMDVGPGVTKVKAGDEVVLHWRKGSGLEGDFPKYGNVGSGKIATFATEAIISENRLTKIKNMPLMYAALLGCAVTTGFGAVINEAKVEIGSKILIIGLGGIGLTIAHACHMVGAGEITALDKKESKENIALAHNVRNFILSTDDLEGPYDYIFDTVSKDILFNKSWKHLSGNGKYILIGQTAPDTKFIIEDTNLLFGENSRQIIISQGGSTNPDVDIPKYINAFLGQKWFPNLFISSHYTPLSQINRAIETLYSGNCCRVLVKTSI